MPIAFKTALGNAAGTSSGTSLVITTTAAIAVDDFVVVRVASDNLSATTPTFTCADSASGGSNTYVQQVFTGQNATAAAGVVGAILASKAVRAVPSGGTITITLSGAVAHKAAYAESFTGIGTFGVVGNAKGASTTASVTGSYNAGELVLAAVGIESRAAPTFDSDTVNGSWSTGVLKQSATSGSDATCVEIAGQYKILTANGSQTYNLTNASTDWVALLSYAIPAPEPSITQAAYQFFDDAGTESGAASLAAQDAAITGNLANGDGFGMIRIRLQSTTAVAVPAADDFKLQWEKNASGTWNDAIGEALFDSYPEVNYDNDGFIAQGPGTTAMAQSFIGNGQRLTRAGFYIKRVGAPSFSITAQLWTHTGTFGTNGVPLSLVETSNSVAVSSVGTSFSWVEFSFAGTSTLTNGTPYCIGLFASPAGDASNYLLIARDTSAPTHPGNSAYGPGSWVSLTTELIFRVYTGGGSTGAVVEYDNPNLTESAATTNRLTGGTGTFVPGKVSEIGHVTNVGWSGNNYTEILYSVKLLAAQLVNGDTLRFRVLRNGATTGMTYTVTPTINIVNNVTLVVGNADHGHTADNLDLVQVAPPVDLVVQNAAHAIKGLVEHYLTGTTGYASTPDYGTLTSPCVWSFKIRGPTGGASAYTIAQQADPGNTNLQWLVARNTSGVILWPFSNTGTSSNAQLNGSTQAVQADDEWLGITASHSSGTPSVTGKISSNGGQSWTNGGTDTYGTTPLFDSTADVTIGRASQFTSWNYPAFPGRIYWVECRTGTDPNGGTVLWRFDASEHVSGTSWTDARGRNWTLSTASAITHATDLVLTEVIPTALVVQNATHTVVSQQLAEHYLTPAISTYVTGTDFGTLPATWVVVFKVRGGPLVASTYSIFGQRPGSPNDSWNISRNNALLQLQYSATGTGLTNLSVSGVPGGHPYTTEYFAVVFAGAIAGGVQVHKSVDLGATWTQVGSTTGVGVSFFDTAGNIVVGGASTTQYPGQIFWAEMRSGTDPVGGSLLWRMDVAEHVSGTSWVDARGKTWSISNPALLTHSPATSDITLAHIPATDLVVQNCQHAFVNQTDMSAFFVPLLAGSTRVTTPDPVTMPSTGFVFVLKAKGPQSSTTIQAAATQYRVDPTRSWLLERAGADGRVTLWVTTSGTNATAVAVVTSGTLQAVDRVNAEYWAVAYNATTGAWRTLSSTDSGANYIQRSSGTATPTALFDSADPVLIGGSYTGGVQVWDDSIWWVELRTGNDPKAGTLLWRFDANDHVSGTSWTDARGHTWTMGLAAGVVHPTTTSPTLTEVIPPVNLVVDNGLHAHISGMPGTGTLYTDDFNRADGALGSGWIDSGGFAIASNRLTRQSGGGSDHATFTQDVGSPDMFVEADLYSGGAAQGGGDNGYVCIQARNDGGVGQNSYMGFYNPTGDGGFASTWQIGKVQGGGYSDVDFVDATGVGYPPQGSKLRMEVEGSTIRLYHDGVLKLTTTDTSITTGNYGGVNTNYVSPVTGYDNFRVGLLGAVGVGDVVLGQTHVLTVADAAHAYTAANVALVVDLVVQSAAHTVVSTGVALGVDLAAANCTHAPIAGMPGVGLAHTWTGADPVGATDTTPYNIGTWISLFSPVTFQGVRIWNPGLVTPQGGHNRQAYLWTHNGTGGSASIVATIDIPDLLPTGWSEHLFSTPYSATTGVSYCISYWVDGGSTAGTADYGAVAGGLSGNVDNPPIRFEAGGRYTPGGTPGSAIPSTSGTAFYGVDILYGTPAGVTDIKLIVEPAVQNATHASSADNVALGVSLVASNCLHAVASDNVTLTESVAPVNLVVADGLHASVADNPTLSYSTTLAVQDAAHAHVVDSVTLVAVPAIQSAIHAHSADNVTVTEVGFAVQAAAHVVTSDNVALIVNLAIADAVHAQTASNVAIDVVVVVSSATHAHTAASPTLYPVPMLVVEAGSHASTADNVGLVVDLAVANATHAHSAANVVLYPVPDLVVPAGVLTHTAVSPTLVVDPAVQGAAHAVTSPDVIITPGLLVDAARHLHEAQEVNLSGVPLLIVQPGVHVHTADNVPLSVSLAVQDATHAHTAANVTPLGVSLVVAAATHVQIAPEVLLTQLHVLVVDNCFSPHSADHVEIYAVPMLVVSAGLHVHSANHVLLVQDHFLAIESAAHTHTVDADLVLVLGLTVGAALHAVSSDEVDMRGALILNNALALYLNSTPVSRVYVGSAQVWP